jgi:shikimate dehydrogenase
MTEIDGQTRLLGIIGWPVEHTLSPKMHNAAFSALEMNWVYLALPVQPNQLESALQGMLALGFCGANVTVPHKRAVMRYLRDVSTAAQALGAVNTIVVEEDGRMVGDNTDWAGFLAALKEKGLDPRSRRAMILGAGGAARAITYALARSGAEVVILNRSPMRGQSLVEDLALSLPSGSLRSRPLDHDGLVDEAARSDLLINATPVGMWPDDESSLWPDALPFPSHLLACDLVYRPRETKLLRQARQAGAVTVDGLGMLVHQGRLAFEMWTGQWPPLEVMRAACEQALGVG